MVYTVVLFVVSVVPFTVLISEFFYRGMVGGFFFHILDISQDQARVNLGSGTSKKGFAYFLGKILGGVFMSLVS